MEMKQVSIGRNSRARSGYFHRFDSAVSDHGPRQIAPIDQPHDCLRELVDAGEIHCTSPWLNSLIGFPSRVAFARMNIAMFKKLSMRAPALLKSIKNCGSRKFRLAGDRYPTLAKGRRVAKAAERHTYDRAIASYRQIISELLHARS